MVTPIDLAFPSRYGPKELGAARFAICKECPELIKATKTCKKCEFLFKKTNTCKKCGCFMVAKTKLEKATCPIGKW